MVICVEELNYMKDYMKVKITKIACKYTVKSDSGQKNFVGIIKRRESLQPFPSLHLHASVKLI